MTPAARIKTTIDVLDILKARKLPMDLLIGDYMRNRRYIGSKDRANIVERVYTIIRHHARIGWHIERLKIEDTSQNRVLVYLAGVEIQDSKRIQSLFDGSKYGGEPLTPDEVKIVDTLVTEDFEHKDMPVTVQTETPPLYAEKLQNKFGDDFADEMRAFMNAATLDLRINTHMADREKVQKFLDADNVETTPTPYAPNGLRVQGKTYLSRTKAFSKGWIDIQDEGSQLIAHACNPAPGMQVLDYCAGAGGKTLALGSMMNVKGRIVAMDTDARRLNKSKQRIKRAWLSDIVEIRPLSEDRHRKWLKRQKGTMDITLCDVPCTGTGTWRRNPDMRLTTYGPDLEELTGIQADILEKVARTVKPGGKLVYATCSILPDENEHQIAAFLERHPEYKIGSYHECIPTTDIDGMTLMSLTPLRHNTDGFFAAVMERVS